MGAWRPRPGAVDPAALDALRAVPAHCRDRALVEVLVGCGLRVREACELRVADLAWDGGGPVGLRVARPQGGARWVPMNDQVQTALRAWLEARGGGDYVFGRLGGGGRLSRRGLWAALRRQCGRAGCAPVTATALRRTFAARLVAQGVPAEQVRGLLGWAPERAGRAPAQGSAADLRRAVERLDARPLWVRWRSRRRNRAFRVVAGADAVEAIPAAGAAADPATTRPEAPAADSGPDPLPAATDTDLPAAALPVATRARTVGRDAELARLEGCVARGIHVLLLGPVGVGKSHLLALLEGEHLIRLPGLAQPRHTVLALAGALFAHGVRYAARPGCVVAGRGRADQEPSFAEFARAHTRTGVADWLTMVLEALPADTWTLVLDDLSDVTAAGVRLLDGLATRFTIVAGSRAIRPALAAHFARFDQIPVRNLAAPDAGRLVRQAAAGAPVEDGRLLETHVWQQTAGNPRAILEMVTRLRKEPGLTRQAVRRLQHAGPLPQLDLTPAVIVLLIGVVGFRYVALGLGDREVYVLAGLASVVAMAARYLLRRHSR